VENCKLNKNMNYRLNINEVDLSAFLIALGFTMEEYTINNYIDLNTGKSRPKSGAWRFSDYSEFKQLGNAENVVKSYKLPEKGKPIKNIAERAKLTAHNYQVLKSVVLENKPLMQLNGDGYTMLKNDNGNTVTIADSTYFTTDETTDLMLIAIACAMGCRVATYYFDANKMLHVMLYASSDGTSVKRIEQEKQKALNDNSENDFNDVAVLVATGINRKELLSGVYSKERVVLIRGTKHAIFDKDANEETKQKILEELNA
jgi:hypothetical protein